MPQYSQEKMNKIALEAMIEKKNRLQQEVNELEKAIREMKVTLQLPAIGRFTEKLISENGESTPALPNGAIPSKLQVRKVILDIFDKYKRPLKMNDIQDDYTKMTGVNYNIRENVRSLNNQGTLKLMKINESNRNAYWVKDEWVDDLSYEKPVLIDSYKFDGFDAMFKPEDISFS